MMHQLLNEQPSKNIFSIDIPNDKHNNKRKPKYNKIDR